MNPTTFRTSRPRPSQAPRTAGLFGVALPSGLTLDIQVPADLQREFDAAPAEEQEAIRREIIEPALVRQEMLLAARRQSSARRSACSCSSATAPTASVTARRAASPLPPAPPDLNARVRQADAARPSTGPTTPVTPPGPASTLFGRLRSAITPAPGAPRVAKPETRTAATSGVPAAPSNNVINDRIAGGLS